MKRQPVDSTSIKSIGYDMIKSILEVEFKGEKVYQYADVPATEWAKLLRADSQGKYFYAKIKPRYAGVAV